MQTKNTTAPPKAQEQARESDIRGLIVIIPCVRGISPGIQFPPLAVKGLAVEVLEMLRPEFPGAEFRCFQVAEENYEAALQVILRHKDLVLSCREADHPGRVYLERLHMTREVEGAYARGGAL